jgi:hypothetical protein
MAIGDILREPDVGRSIDRVERPYDRGDVEAILNPPFYIGANVKTSATTYWKTRMAKRKKKPSPEELAAREAGFRESQRRLQERIAYHRAKIEEERKDRREAS